MIFWGIGIGVLGTWLFFRNRLECARKYDQEHEIAIRLQAELAAERVITQNYRQQLEGLEERLSHQFKSVSLELFKENAQAFVQLAEQGVKQYSTEAKDALSNQRVILEKMMEPLKLDLERFTQKVEQLERGRQQTDITFKEQLQQLNQVQVKLENKTDLLTHAFCNPNQRGRWGELQLRRIVEVAGMLEYVDFEVQVSVQEGAFRPDMVIRLPNDRCVIVDAKTPQLEDYLVALQEQKDEAAQQKILKNACLRIRELVAKLSAKNYGAQFEQSADFVVLFFPGEWIFSHALQADSELIEYACKHNVVFATPTTLIALLKAIHYGWRQNKMIEEVRAVERLGSELYERMVNFAAYFQDLRKNLGKTVESFNQVLGSLEARMLPAARKLNAFSKKNLELHFPETLEITLKESSKTLGIKGNFEENLEK